LFFNSKEVARGLPQKGPAGGVSAGHGFLNTRPNKGVNFMTTTRCGVLSGLILSIGLFAMPAHAQVSVNVHIGEPPPVVVYSPPTMVLMPEPQMYVAVGVPYDIFFVSGRYYYFHGGHWFWGSGYGGPWTYVAVETLPPGLRRYKVAQLRDFREREYRVYKVQGPKFRGTYFVAERHDDDQGEHHGRGHGKGKKHD
jgi:hypothetical protein